MEYNGDQKACQAQITNYKSCKKFWYDISQFRRENGLRPYLPELEDRLEIKKDYMKARNLDATCQKMLDDHRQKEAQKA